MFHDAPEGHVWASVPDEARGLSLMSEAHVTT